MVGDITLSPLTLVRVLNPDKGEKWVKDEND